LAPISWAGDVYNDKQGWVIFGGGPEDLKTSQKLVSLDGAWEEGPKLFNQETADHGLCALQVICVNIGPEHR
jgi:hypothetical protein